MLNVRELIIKSHLLLESGISIVILERLSYKMNFYKSVTNLILEQ